MQNEAANNFTMMRIQELILEKSADCTQELLKQFNKLTDNVNEDFYNVHLRFIAFFMMVFDMAIFKRIELASQRQKINNSMLHQLSEAVVEFYFKGRVKAKDQLMEDIRSGFKSTISNYLQIFSIHDGNHLEKILHIISGDTASLLKLPAEDSNVYRAVKLAISKFMEIKMIDGLVNELIIN